MEVFDKVGALDRVAGDKGFLLELFEIALEDSKERLAKIESVIHYKDAKGLSEAAHALKSAMGNIGAMTCHASCMALENMGKLNDFSNASAEFQNLLKQIELFKEQIALFEKEQ